MHNRKVVGFLKPLKPALLPNQAFLIVMRGRIKHRRSHDKRHSQRRYHRRRIAFGRTDAAADINNNKCDIDNQSEQLHFFRFIAQHVPVYPVFVIVLYQLIL